MGWDETWWVDRIRWDKIGSGRVGSDRIGSDRVGSDRVGSGGIGSGRVGSDRIRWDRIGSDRVGLDQVGSTVSPPQVLANVPAWSWRCGMPSCPNSQLARNQLVCVQSTRRRSW